MIGVSDRDGRVGFRHLAHIAGMAVMIQQLFGVRPVYDTLLVDRRAPAPPGAVFSRFGLAGKLLRRFKPRRQWKAVGLLYFLRGDIVTGGYGGVKE